MEQKTLLIPFMGYHSYFVRSVFRLFKIDSEVMPQSDKQSLELGRKLLTGKECLPCILTTGDMVKALSTNNPSRIAFFMPESCGPCRFGQYNRLQRLLLKDIGYEDVPIISPNQAKDFYKTLYDYGNGFDRVAWYGICIMDFLDKQLMKTRPYEINKGETDAIYLSMIDLICKTTESNGLNNKFTDIAKQIRQKFNKIPKKKERKPVIGITGEIYIRTHPFSNDNLIRKLEELGGEVEISDVAEWFFYVNFRRLEDAVAEKNYKQWLLHFVKNSYQQWVKMQIKDTKESTQKLFKYAYPYLHHTVEGEAVLSVGKCIEFVNKGAAGVVTVMPFNCMPGTNTAAVMTRVKEIYKIPYLNIAYDGLQQTSLDIRLSAFMHQAKQKLMKHG